MSETENRLRFGFLGASRIGASQTLPAIIETGHEVYAVASRSQRSLHHEYDGLTNFQAYNELLDDTTIDAVYISLPNDAHYPWTMKALEAGKHVLVEKPGALTSDEWAAMSQKAQKSQRVLMEAIMYRHHPQWDFVSDILEQLGPLQRIIAEFSHPLDIEGDYRNDPNKGGGALLDLGVYAVNAALSFSAPPERLAVVENKTHSHFPVDGTIRAQWESAGILVDIRCSFETGPTQLVELQTGSGGSIIIKHPFTLSKDHNPQIYWKVDGQQFDINVPQANSYSEMIREFNERIQRGQFVSTDDRSFETLKVLDMIRQAIS